MQAFEFGHQFILLQAKVRIVYLGHRDGTAIVVREDSDIRDFGDLAGTTVAIPMRYANQNLLMHKMMKEWGMPYDSIDLRELPPPEHPTALAEGSIQGYIVGEPFAAKAEVEGFGRVLLAPPLEPGGEGLAVVAAGGEASAPALVARGRPYPPIDARSALALSVVRLLAVFAQEVFVEDVRRDGLELRVDRPAIKRHAGTHLEGDAVVE